jgi:hypothetical protein
MVKAAWDGRYERIYLDLSHTRTRFLADKHFKAI